MIKQSYDAGYQAAFDKIAIDLASARKAYNAVVKPSLFRASIKAAPAERVLAPVGFMDKLKSNLFGAPRSSPTKPFENIKDRLSASGAMSQVRKPPRIEQPRPALRVDNQVPGAAAYPGNSQKITNVQPGIYVNKQIARQVDPQGFSQLNPQNREMVNRTVGLHEGMEMQVMRDPKWQAMGQKGVGGFLGHAHPEVLLRENNIISTMSPELSGARNFMTNIRQASGEANTMNSLYPGFNFGNQRLSRHAIRRMRESYDARVLTEMKRRGLG